MSESRPKIYALKSYSGSVAVRRSSTGARGRMPSSSSGPPWSYKDGPFLPVSFLGLLLVSFFFWKDFVTPGVHFGSTFAMVTTVNPKQITAISSIGAMGSCNCSNVACVGSTCVSTFLDSCCPSRYLSLSNATGGCYCIAYTCPASTAYLSVRDKVSTMHEICYRQVHFPHSAGVQSCCMIADPAGVGFRMLFDINHDSQGKLRIGVSQPYMWLCVKDMRDGLSLLNPSCGCRSLKPCSPRSDVLDLYGLGYSLLSSDHGAEYLGIRTFPLGIGSPITAQQETAWIDFGQDSLLDWCSAAICVRQQSCDVTSPTLNRCIQDGFTRMGKHLHLTLNLTYNGTVKEVFDFPPSWSDDGDDDAAGLVHDVIDAAVFAIASLLLYSTCICQPRKANVCFGFCFFAQLRWILRDGKIWHLLATCCQKIGTCRGNVQIAAHIQECSPAATSTMCDGLFTRLLIEFCTGHMPQLHHHIDSTAAMGIPQRSGVGRIRHLSTRVLCTQAAVAEGKLCVA